MKLLLPRREVEEIIHDDSHNQSNFIDEDSEKVDSDFDNDSIDDSEFKGSKIKILMEIQMNFVDNHSDDHKSYSNYLLSFLECFKTTFIKKMSYGFINLENV